VPPLKINVEHRIRPEGAAFSRQFFMAPLMKDTLDVANPASETTSAPRPKTAAPAMRADALSLEVQIKVHGSKVTEVGRGLPPRTEPFEEQTSTMIVFPQGAVLRLASPVNAGQTVVLTNLKTRKDAICRVVKVRANANLQSYVEVEFTSSQAGYWGVTFPGALAAPASAASTVTPRPVAPPPPPPVTLPEPQKPSAPTSTFTTIGSQEKVQPSAAEISRPVPPVPQPRSATPFAPLPANEPPLDEARLSAAIGTLPQVESSAQAKPISLEELQGDSQDSSESRSASAESSALSTSAMEEDPESSDRADRPVFGSFGSFATSPAAAEPASTATFGARLEGSLSSSASAPRASGQNWFLIAACIGFLFVAVAAGVFFFRSHAAMHASASNSPASQATPNPLPSAPADSSVLGPSVSPDAKNAAATFSSQPAASTVSNSALRPYATPATAATTPLAAPAHVQPAPKPAVTSAMVSETLNSHPVAPQHADNSSAEAPALDSSADGDDSSAALPGAISSPSGISIPTPRLQPEGPVKIGGQVKEPRLVSAPAPVYPQTAIQMNVQGDVVIQAVIDKAGNVAEAHVVSGPPLLRAAALEALRRWRYQPSILDGQPISVQMLVTIHFRR
jgi:periplasmic protein TonB